MILSSNEILQAVNDFLEKLPYDRKPQSLYPICVVARWQTYSTCADADGIQPLQG